MKTSDFTTPAVLIPLIVALTALGGNLINAYITIRTKKLEILFAKRSAAYERYLVEAVKFAHSDSEVRERESEYRDYLAACMAVKVVASKAVAAELNKPLSVDYQIQRIRAAVSARDITAKINITSEGFYESITSLEKVIRKDMNRLA